MCESEAEDRKIFKDVAFSQSSKMFLNLKVHGKQNHVNFFFMLCM